MDDDPGPSRTARILILGLFVALAAWLGAAEIAGTSPAHADELTHATGEVPAEILGIMSPGLLVGIIFLVCLSAFFSGSEVAFFSIHKLRLRRLRETGGLLGPLVARIMERPGKLLATILIGNMIVNVLVSVLLPARVEQILVRVYGMSTVPAYVVTVLSCTFVLVFFGEITPKVFAVRISEAVVKGTVLPLYAVGFVLAPVRWAVLAFTDFFFHVTRFNDIKAAPFITDEEFKSALSNVKVLGGIEEEDQQMIEGILEFRDALLREILVPRPDVIALRHDATVGEALELYRKHEFSRMPIYAGDLDHITGMLHAKDLLPFAVSGDLAEPISALTRKAYFVPETMTIQEFVKDTQRIRVHLGIVVDEYGGTEGIVTLEDAIEEVVGDIRHEAGAPRVSKLGLGVFRVDGGFPLDELSDLIGLELEDEKHETVGGFVMNRTNKIPERGDQLEHRGALFTVEEVEGKRASRVRIELRQSATLEGKS